MKRIVLLLALLLTLVGCSNSTVPGENTKPDDTETVTPEKHEIVPTKDSPDKYTAYIKDYVSRNCATVGYESMGGDRNDYVGKGYIHLIMVAESGEYIGVSNDELKNYVVVAQSLEPNTEVKFTFQTDSDGEEYDNLIEWQNIREIVLKVKPVGSKDKTTGKGMTSIKPDPDKYTSYVKDYVGRNLASCGYISWGGELRDEYGESNIKLIIVTNDGSYIDLGDENIQEILKGCVVTGQSAAPNTEIKFEFEKNSKGEEYSWTSWQSREELELYVEKL
jgi:hypothetical protein